VVHGTDEDLLTAAFVLATSAGVSIAITRHGAGSVGVIAALIAWALLEEAFARLLVLPLIVGPWRLRGCSVCRSGTAGVAILRRSAVLLALCLAAFVPTTAAAAMSLPLTLPLWVLSLLVLALRRSILGLRLHGSLRLRGRGRV
jgi:hypothetical protein